MRLPLLLSLLGLATNGHAYSFRASESNLTYFGAPRLSLDPITPTVDIAENYIRSQTDGGATALGFSSEGGCSADHPCLLGACCNSDGGFQLYIF
jgi:hypothetical protein